MAKRRKYAFHPQRIIDDFEELVDISRQNRLTIPKDRREAYIYAVHAWGTFCMQISVFEIRWRYKIGDWSKSLKETCDIADNAARFWRQFQKEGYSNLQTDKPYTPDGIRWSALPATPGAVRFQFATAALLEILTSEGPTEDCVSCVPAVKEWKVLPDRYPSSYVDAGLYLYLTTGERPRGWNERIKARYADLPGGETAFRTFGLYDRIIRDRDTLTAKEVQALLDEGDELFKERAKASDDVFEGWEGSDTANEQCLDFRLAAILRHCFADNSHLYASLRSPHKYEG